MMSYVLIRFTAFHNNGQMVKVCTSRSQERTGGIHSSQAHAIVQVLGESGGAKDHDDLEMLQ